MLTGNLLSCVSHSLDVDSKAASFVCFTKQFSFHFLVFTGRMLHILYQLIHELMTFVADFCTFFCKFQADFQILSADELFVSCGTVDLSSTASNSAFFQYTVCSVENFYFCTLRNTYSIHVLYFYFCTKLKGTTTCNGVFVWANTCTFTSVLHLCSLYTSVLLVFQLSHCSLPESGLFSQTED